MKKLLLSTIITSVLLLSACEEKKTTVNQPSKASQVATEQAQKEALNVQIVNVFSKGQPNEICLDEDENTERKFNSEEPLCLEVQVPETNQKWLNNQLLIDAAKFFIDPETQSFNPSADDLKQQIASALGKLYQAMSKEVLELLEEMKAYELQEGNIKEEEWEPSSPMITSQYYALKSHFIGQVEQIATFNFYYDNYTGGAHGWHNHVVRNADLARKIIIEVKDLVGENNENALKDLLWNAYQKEFSDMEYINKEDFTISPSFTFGKEGVLFNYPPYAVAPYAAGDIELLVEWQQIAPLLTETYQQLPQYPFTAEISKEEEAAE